VNPFAIPKGVFDHMATTINKKRLLTQVLSRARATKNNDELQPVLEQFVYGLCREDATPAQAERAFRFLRERFFDWNEVRVSSIRELEEAFDGMTGPEGRAQRLVSFLQEVFETEFSFDLEGLHKRGMKQASRQLMRYQAANDFVGAWVVQRSLGGHAIPLDAPTLRCVRRLGLLDGAQESLEAARASLEHAVSKNDGPQFTDALSCIAEEYCWEETPQCSSCPLSGECHTAQEGGIEPQPQPTARTHRPKSR
jgi:endonuclease-3